MVRYFQYSCVVSISLFAISINNISDKAYLDLSLNSLDTGSSALSDCQFLTNAMIRPRSPSTIDFVSTLS